MCVPVCVYVFVCLLLQAEYLSIRNIFDNSRIPYCFKALHLWIKIILWISTIANKAVKKRVTKLIDNHEIKSMWKLHSIIQLQRLMSIKRLPMVTCTVKSLGRMELSVIARMNINLFNHFGQLFGNYSLLNGCVYPII